MNTPDAQDYEKVEREYCVEHGISLAEYHRKIARDDHFAGEMFRLAQASKLIREVT